MSYLILVRHGQSVWNLEKKFTGWVDVDLTTNGKSEAIKAGELIKMKNINIDIYYSSFQLRAKNTLKLIKQELQDQKVSKEAWQLNERHYGALTGLNKDEMKAKKILVALSGGVDSSVAAVKLKMEGYDVTGVTLRLYNQPNSSKSKSCFNSLILFCIEEFLFSNLLVLI